MVDGISPDAPIGPQGAEIFPGLESTAIEFVGHFHVQILLLWLRTPSNHYFVTAANWVGEIFGSQSPLL
jgi:hypothetical protein